MKMQAIKLCKYPDTQEVAGMQLQFAASTTQGSTQTKNEEGVKIEGILMSFHHEIDQTSEVIFECEDMNLH